MGNKNKVLGRLVGREAASMVGLSTQATAAQDLERATKRVVEQLHIPQMQAMAAVAKIVRHLQGCDLTINFYVHKFFNSKPKGGTYLSMFERSNAEASDGYVTTRDVAEEAMFDYSGTKTRPGVPQEVSARAKELGALSEPTFQANSRPKYAALNYACLLYGSAGLYGRSHMVLKEHMKHNATYVHADSFDVTNGDFQRAEAAGKMATFFNMHRLIANMHWKMLEATWDAANGKRLGKELGVPGLGGTSYIEGQVHSELRYDRDIDRIVISISELNNAYAETQLLKSRGEPYKVRGPGELEKVFRKFGDKHNIRIVMA